MYIYYSKRILIQKCLDIENVVETFKIFNEYPGRNIYLPIIQFYIEIFENE